MKPLLAATVKDVDSLNYPVYASPKLDGVRCLIKDGQAVSRSLKPIPNEYIQSMLSHPGLEGLDGELIVGSPTDPQCFSNTQSAVMTKAGQPDFTYHVFDMHHHPDVPFHQRLFSAQSCLIENKHFEFLRSVIHYDITNATDLLTLENQLLGTGYEGVMIRDIHGVYKYGRSTLKQGTLLKLKRFVDSEAQVVGYEELMHNNNAAKVDELGHTERSSHKAGMVAADTLGALVVQDLTSGIQFNIGTGFTQEARDTIWAGRDDLIGKIVKYKSFAVGVKEAPRFPVFLGFRDKRDMS